MKRVLRKGQRVCWYVPRFASLPEHYDIGTIIGVGSFVADVQTGAGRMTIPIHELLILPTGKYKGRVK